MKLIYCAYSILDQIEAPDWLEKLHENRTVKREGWGLYDPAIGFRGNVGHPAIATSLADQGKVSQEVAKAYKTLRLDPLLFAPIDEVKDRLLAADRFATTDVSFKHLYALLRADILLLDLNVPSHGGKFHESLYAHLFGIPIVGIAHRFILSPWTTERCDALVFPKDTDEIVRQVLAFDRRTSAMIEEHDGVESADPVS